MITKLIHSTSLKGYNGIIESLYLYNQHCLSEKGIIFKGEGGGQRRIGDRMVTIEDKNWWKHYDEGRGIYFRIDTDQSQDRDPFVYGGEVVLEFSPDLLKQYPDWILNTEENFGFVIGKHGEEAESPFSGDIGKTLYGTYEESDLVGVNNDVAELVIDVPEINMDNLINVKFKNKSIKNKALPPPLKKKSWMDSTIEFLFGK